MLSKPGLEPIDYLLIGHIAKDVSSAGIRVGGTVTYAALTAQALGLRVGIVTSWGEELEIPELTNITILNLYTEKSTTFENIDTPIGRKQAIHHRASVLDYHNVPQLWRRTPIVHLAPIAQDINPNIIRHFENSDLFITPQGWLRQWNDDGAVHTIDWIESDYLLPYSKAIVISEEDVNNNENRINRLARASKILIVTRGKNGASLYMEGSEFNIQTPVSEELDSTGAGDIFSAAFFIKFNRERDPIKAVEFANQIASRSVTRKGLASAPTSEDLYDINIEVF